MVFVGYNANCLGKFLTFTDLSIDPSTNRKKPIIYLSLIQIKDGMIPKDWPLESMLGSSSSGNLDLAINSDLNQRNPDDIVDLENGMYLKHFKLYLQ